MKKKTLSSIVATAVVAAMSISTVFAQLGNDLNNGTACGCPAVGSRTIVDLATLGTPIVQGGQNQIEIQHNVHLTCDNIYTFSKKIFVGYHDTLTIDPGTVLKGVNPVPYDPNQSPCLLIERGGYIKAEGTADCKIIMTGSNDPLDGTYSMTNVGDWGGFVICGVASNNLLSAYNYGSGKKGSKWNGVGYIEGADNSLKTMWGAGDTITLANGQAVNIPTHFNDNDNSGIMTFVSVRHAGALIGTNTAGNELNGISLYSVGRGTKIENCETIAAADDNFEFFGGTVDMRHENVMFGDDDFYDFDLGYSGRMQFNFGIAGDTLTGLHSTDNGYECDTDDQSAAGYFPGDSTTFKPWSLPQIYNNTLISNGHIRPTADNTGPAAIQAKEITGGTFINNVFVNFRSGLHVAQARSNSTNHGDAYDNWTNDKTDVYLVKNGGAARYHSLVVKNNTFVHCNLTGTPQAVPYGGATYNPLPNGISYWITKGVMTHNPGSGNWTYVDATPASAADTLQFCQDGNTHPQALTGIDYTWSWNTGHTALTDKYHAVPSSNIPLTSTYGCNTTTALYPPADGWFERVSYRGAFDATKDSWLANGYAIPVASSLRSDNPTDLNNDGITNIDDFSIFIGKFGQKDQ